VRLSSRYGPETLRDAEAVGSEASEDGYMAYTLEAAASSSLSQTSSAASASLPLTVLARDTYSMRRIRSASRFETAIFECLC
jgi:hypothetical protein